MNSNKVSRRGFLLKMSAVAGSVMSGLVAPRLLSANAGGRLTGATMEGSPGQLTVSLALDEPVEYKVFTLASPDRVVIDLQNTLMGGKLKQGAYNRPPVVGIRYAERPDGSLRVVLDLSEEVSVSSNMLPQGSKNTLKVTLQPTGKGSTGGTPPSTTRNTPKTEPAVDKKSRSKTKPASDEPAQGKFIVVIDPGHGGKDPGAIGPNNTREKDVVLEIARKLRTRLNREKGVKAILTRDSDTFIPLRDRIGIAHQHKADLFISVHADANPNSRITGSTVYILSETGASSEAAKLIADSENSYDLKFGSLALSNATSQLASVLLDLSQNAMTDRSLQLAKNVLGELSKVNNPLRRGVESARFMVLRSPDIPSMLVETAFISNPTEERRLKTADYQQKLASAIFNGVKRYQLAYAGSNSRNA